MRRLPSLLLLLGACSKPVERPTASLSTTTPDTVALPRLAMTVTCTEAAKWADTLTAPGSITYRWLRCIPAQVVVDSQRVVLADIVTLGMPFGLFHLPADSLCKGLGYSAIAFTVQSDRLWADLAKVRGCNGKAVLLLPRGKSIVNGNLSVAGMTQAIRSWDSSTVAKALADSTIIAINVADDITSTEYGPASLQTRLARWDSAAVAARSRWATAPVSMRARASQMRGVPFKGVTVLWVQYNGPFRDRQPAAFALAQADSAKALNLALMLGLNLLDGGCGPTTDQPADTLRRCPKGIPGSNQAGSWGPSDSAAISVHRYLMSGAELGYYGAAMLAQGCAQVNWQWSPVLYQNSSSARWQRIRQYHADSLVKAAAKTVGLMARSSPFTRCTR